MYTVLGVALCVAVLFVLVTQVVIPAMAGRVIWPMFRREAKLKAELAEARQAKYEAQLEKEVSSISKERK